MTEPSPAESALPAAADRSTPAPPDDLRARLYDAALGELTPDEIIALQRDIARHPDPAPLQAELQRVDHLLRATAENPALLPLQPRESWRVQTLHKGKVAAARLRKDRSSKSMPVARPPITHRQLAGLTPQSITAFPDVPVGDADAPALADLPLLRNFGPDRVPGEPRQDVRHFFWVVIGVGLLSVLVLLVIAVRVMQHWQSTDAATHGGPAGSTPPDPAPEGGSPLAPRALGEVPLTALERLTLQAKFGDLTQILHSGAAGIRLERGGAITPARWPRIPAPVAVATPPPPAPAAVPPNPSPAPGTPGALHMDADHDRYLGPAISTGWDLFQLDGEALAQVSWVYVPDDPKGLMLVLRPKRMPATDPAAPAAPPADGPPNLPQSHGWELEVRKNLTQLALFDIPAPPASATLRLRAMAIERIALANEQEELRFKVLCEPMPVDPSGQAAPLTPDSPVDPVTPAEWTVLSERILPVKSGPGRWAIELPKNQPLPALVYRFRQTVPRQTAQPDPPPQP